MITIHRMLQLTLVVSLFYLTFFPATVMAHVRWALDSVTPPRSNDTGLKVNPCGGKDRTDRSTIFSAGQTIEVKFEETVNHPGHYRIAFSPANDLNFDSYVLEDNIPDITNNGMYTMEINIPMEICSQCTLQVIQVMTTSDNPQPRDFYYSCSDIQITSPGDTTAPAPVTGLTPQEGDSQVTLNWSNPDSDFYQAVIIKSTSPVLDMPVDGTLYAAGDSMNASEVIYVGNANTHTATALTNDTQYYFKVFAQNPRKNYSAGIETVAMPVASATDTGGDSDSGKADSPDDSGGGSMNALFILFLLTTRMYALRKISSRA